MNNYVCKVADRDELIKRWKYLVEIHPVNNIWEKFRDYIKSTTQDNELILFYKKDI